MWGMGDFVGVEMFCGCKKWDILRELYGGIIIDSLKQSIYN